MGMLRIFLVLVGFAIVSGCGQFVYVDGPYRGRVFDPATGRPIEGAAVLAVWWTESGLLVPHPIEGVHDAKETVTDAQGNFTIEGTSNVTLNPTFRVKTPAVMIFKPGYRLHQGPLLAEEDPQLVPLRLLKTKEERLDTLRRLSVSYRVPRDKYPNLLRLEDIERINLGLQPMHQKGG
jgi:hypothetical protein